MKEIHPKILETNSKNLPAAGCGGRPSPQNSPHVRAPMFRRSARLAYQAAQALLFGNGLYDGDDTGYGPAGGSTNVIVKESPSSPRAYGSTSFRSSLGSW
jgi:hypothetical protein